MKNKPRTARRLGVESLESRQMMAGDVTVSVSCGDLTITGDGAANGIIMYQMGEGQYRIAGVSQGGAATRIRMGNSIASYQTVTGVNDDVTINMQGGNDYVTIMQNAGYAPYTTLPDDLTMNMGNGDDSVRLQLLKVGDDALVDLGSNNDALLLNDLIVGREDGSISHNLDIRGQGGSDWIHTADVSVDQDLVVVRGDMIIDTGTSNESDDVRLVGMHVLDDLEIRTYAGRDTVLVSDAEIADDLTVEAGDGTDYVTIGDTAADEIFARMGSGTENALRVTWTTARRATFDGGPGTGDRLTLQNVFIDQPSIFGFEVT